MARLYTKENRIQKKWKWYSFLSVATKEFSFILFGGMLVSVPYSLYFKTYTLLYALIPSALLILLCRLCSHLAANQARVLNAGVVGENATKQLIRHLPGGYSAISNVRIAFSGEESELDMVVVGPTGVFVIETKNYTGLISGRADDTNWKRVKKADCEKAYAVTLYNPIKQVSTHAYRLSKYLKQNKLFVWVQGAVYFSDANVALKISGNTKKIPIFRAEPKTPTKQNKLLRFIRSFPIQKRLSPKTVDKIVRLLRA